MMLDAASGGPKGDSGGDIRNPNAHHLYDNAGRQVGLKAETLVDDNTHLQLLGDEQSAAKPTKKRKFSELDTRARSTSARPPSPPWKSFAAEHPTIITDNGKRRSGRVSQLHQEPSPVRASAQRPTTDRGPKSSVRNKIAKNDPTIKAEDIEHVASTTPKSGRGSTGALPSAIQPKRYVGYVYEVVPDIDPSKGISAIDSTNVLHDKRSRSARHKAKHESPPPALTKKRPYVRRQVQDSPAARSPSPPSAPVHVAPRHPLHIPVPSPYSTLVDLLHHYDVQEKDIALAAALDPAAVIEKPFEKPDRDPAVVAQEEAAARARLLDASRPGGLLSREKCSVYLPNRQVEPQKQYQHSDHLAAHAIYFRTLMYRERARHIDTARKVAHACLARWKEKQPQTVEERMATELAYNRLIYQQLVHDMKRKWDLVILETQKRRLQQWQQDQDMTRDLKMQKLLDDTTRMLDKRRETLEFASPLHQSDADERDDGESTSGRLSDASDASSEADDDDDDMSISSSEGGDSASESHFDVDDNLSPEALRAKYASMHALADADSDGEHQDDDDAGPDQNDGSVTNESPSVPIEVIHAQEIPEDCELDQVDDDMMDDDDDESVGMSDEDMTSSNESRSNDEQSESESHDGDTGHGLLGFLSNDDRRQMEHVPDDSKHASTLLTTMEALVAADIPDHTAYVQDLRSGSKMLAVSPPGGDISSQTTPIYDTTNEPTEVDSTTTVDMDDAPHSVSRADDNDTSRDGRIRIPSLLRATLREYQHFGLDWLAKLYVNQTNGILADEMGLGKTIQTIALLAHLAEEHHVWGPHLIVVPTSVILNWEMEFKKFLPGFKVLSYYGTQDERAAKRKGWSNPDKVNVVITSYQLILKDLSSIRVPEWHYMILDEAHNIKNFQSQRYQAMIRLKTHARLLLTGTPLQNSIQELWSLLTFLTAGQDGQGMGDLDEFTQWFKRPVDEIFVDGKNKLGTEAQEIVNKLHHSLRPYILRRMKSQVEKQLPGKYEHTVFCRLSKRQRQLYDAFLGRADVKEKLRSGNSISVSQALMALRKVCNHPDLFEERPIVTSFTMHKPFSRMPRSVIADYDIKDLLVRRRLLGQDECRRSALFEQDFNLIGHERHSRQICLRTQQHRASEIIMRNCYRQRVARLGARVPEYSSGFIKQSLDYYGVVDTLEHQDRLKRQIQLTERRCFQTPIYGTDLVEACTVFTNDRIRLKASRSIPFSFSEQQHLPTMVKSTAQRAAATQSYVENFAFITPNVVAHDILPHTLTKPMIDCLNQQYAPTNEIDPFHEARVRLSIAFPDRRLLQYDCGKLQRLALLLRQLTSRGSRALIFTQMTSVLNILEQFLNIHGYRYLRLDGSTRIEKRQEMMERFNRDTRLDVFILSSRSGGVGMNLTGADTVIFYDLDWNPQMDKQCQDRAHRIGQTRDVHIYKFVSEHTIEVNILKKSNQKRMLDEVVIQEGEFTTDAFDRPAMAAGTPLAQDGKTGPDQTFEADDEAGAAVDRVLGLVTTANEKPQQASSTNNHSVTKILAAAEEAVDVEAAVARQREAQADDDADFGPEGRKSKTSLSLSIATNNPAAIHDTTASSTPTPMEPLTPVDGTAVDADEREHVDEYMLRHVLWMLADSPIVAPVDKKSKSRLDKMGRDRGHRPKRR